MIKKFRVVDIVIVLAVVLSLVVGFFTYKHFRQTADKQIQSTSKIGFQVFLRGVTITSGVSPIKPGDKTFISIRNVPYTDLKVVNVKVQPKKILMPNPDKKPAFVLVDDYSQMFMYDILVTIVDTAKITKDGAVVGGNKVKIGLPITLEGKDYKLNGTVSDVQIIKDNAKNAAGTQPKAQGQQQPGPRAQAPQAQQTAQPQQSQAQQPAPAVPAKK